MKTKGELLDGFIEELKTKLKGGFISEKDLEFLEQRQLYLLDGFKARKGQFITLVLENGNTCIYLLSRDFNTIVGTERSYIMAYQPFDGFFIYDQHITMASEGSIGQDFYFRFSTEEEIRQTMLRLIGSQQIELSYSMTTKEEVSDRAIEEGDLVIAWALEDVEMEKAIIGRVSSMEMSYWVGGHPYDRAEIFNGDLDQYYNKIGKNK